jgi:hypothetical protein
MRGEPSNNNVSEKMRDIIVEFQQPLTCKLLVYNLVMLSINNLRYETGFKFDACSTAYQ